MRESDTKVDLFDEDLLVINDIRFTPRELDILSCLLKARSTKKIASLLSIYPKTVRNHLHNIMTKLGCNSRDSIIDFVERSEKLSLLKEHYSALFLKASFEQSLKEISKIKREEKVSCKLIYWTETTLNDSLVRNIQAHLNLVGVNTSLELRKNKPIFSELLNELQKDYYRIYILPKTVVETLQASGLSNEKTVSKFPQNNQSNRRLFLLLEKNPEVESFANEGSCSFLNLGIQENYFISFFELLMKLLPNLNVDKIVTEFKDQYNNKKEHSEQNFSQVVLKEKKSENFSFFQRWGYILSIGFFIALLGTGCLFYLLAQKNQEAAFLRSDLIIPVEVAFLNRPELITQIDKAFNGNEGIQTVALVGIGGSGKTTLARQYARQQKAPLIWEINAETKSNLLESFENLAYTLAKTEEDKSILRDLTEIKNSAERQKRLVEFVKGHLKSQSNWFLIYDNVEKFTDIQKYYPLDSETWGRGKVLITTQDSTIQNHKQIDHVVYIGEMDKTQKLHLFTQIMGNGGNNRLTSSTSNETISFLEKIPPFPLDISVAAYYLKTTNVPYIDYLAHLNQFDKDFTTVQENLLKGAGEYTKTRHGIITLSLGQIMKIHKDFTDLLLFISFLDSQHILRELLENFKDKVTVDNFIYHLKKYSLITHDPFVSSVGPAFLMHRSTQDISLNYLKEFLKLDQSSPLLKIIVYALDDYADQVIEQEDFEKMQVMAEHLEKVLKHPNLITNISKGFLESKLAGAYYLINDEKAHKIARDSLNLLQPNNVGNLSSEDIARFSRSLLHIGAVFTELRLYKEAEELFEKTIHIYEKENTKDDLQLSWALSHLGNIYRRTENYEKARELLEKSVRLIRQNGGDKQRAARTLAYLGSVYKGLSLYQKSIDTLEESLSFYKMNNLDYHYRAGWILMQLGNAYRKLGDYKKSVDYLAQSLNVYQKNFNENHIRIGWVLFHLAHTYQAMDEHQKAENLLDKVLTIYSNHCDKKDIETIRLLRDMAEICVDKSNLDDAENYIKRSLQLSHPYKHFDIYRALETLGEIYLKKSQRFSSSQNDLESQKLKTQALDTFNQALKIIEQHFPQNSVHIERIRSKIKMIQG